MEGSEIPEQTALVLAACHSLVNLNGKLIGDPMEAAGLKGIDWSCSRGRVSFHANKIDVLFLGDVSSSKKGKGRLRIVHRFHFTSALQRMSTIAALEHQR